MAKHLDTLIKDIYAVLDTRGGWDAVVSDFMVNEVRAVVQSRLEEEEVEREPTLRMSSIGTPCKRKLWYGLHEPNEREPLPPTARLKFLYGDLLEALLISLVYAAGHRVEGCQDELKIDGIVGHRDAVIDGITVDVKSASPFSFAKFKSGDLRDNDPFGYISQLSSYVYAGRSSDVESHPTVGAFLVINKVSGELCLDTYDFSADIETKEADIAETKRICNNSKRVPNRGFDDVPDGYYNSKQKKFVENGNRKLGINCSYCEFKQKCWPGLRTFMYNKHNGAAPSFLTKVVKTPKVLEVT